MSDAAYLSHGTVYQRWTRGNIRRMAAAAVGLSETSLATGESAILNQAINGELALWRDRLPHTFHGLGERKTVLTFDPDVVDTRLELPADFYSLLSGGRAYLVDSTTEAPHNKLEIITIQAHRESYEDGYSPYDDRAEPVAYLFGLSENKYRFIEIKPVPSTSRKFELTYVAELASLDLDSDELEAPLSLHYPLAWSVGAALLALRGSTQKASVFEAKAEKAYAYLASGNASERRRVGRFLPFDHRTKRGYQAAEYAD